ncbi:hypothetical protein [Williamsia sterculiae]|uniref:Uncharacterized protein n=1 Tax=Williamsia sterculiae TaxID=1344003 RepID=A0A1N7CYP7_9NOCA|nr:hypothetical protein [Williamsia sterculiae]SIR68713.1 hypothetical protein SAMN05445060_0451 [Williamsia sterculiae]
MLHGPYPFVGTVLALLVLCTLWSLIRPSVTAAAVTLLLAVVWLPVNEPVEGAVLLVLTPTHGITQADLISVMAVAVVGVRLWWVRRRRRV